MEETREEEEEEEDEEEDNRIEKDDVWWKEKEVFLERDDVKEEWLCAEWVNVVVGCGSCRGKARSETTFRPRRSRIIFWFNMSVSGWLGGKVDTNVILLHKTL